MTDTPDRAACLPADEVAEIESALSKITPWLAAASPSSVVVWRRSRGDVSWFPAIRRGTEAYVEIEANAQFIAHAPQYVATLLRLLKKERERNATLVSDNYELAAMVGTHTARIAALEQALEHERACVDEIASGLCHEAYEMAKATVHSRALEGK